MERAAGEPGEDRTSARMLGAAPHGSLGARCRPSAGLWGLGVSWKRKRRDTGPPVGPRGCRPGLEPPSGGVEEGRQMLRGAAVSTYPSPCSMPRDHVFMRTGQAPGGQ
ncbi:hypothetical protein VULLAG_LOCUS22375 [Vulpes lagopus]